jgi:hypothetical protein
VESALFRLAEAFGAHGARSRYLEEIMNERVVAVSPIACRARLVLLHVNDVSCEIYRFIRDRRYRIDGRLNRDLNGTARD